MMRIRIEIGELVLNGFDYHDHKRIEAAIVRELSSLVREENGLMQRRVRSKEISKIDTSSFNVNGHAYLRISSAVGKAVLRSLEQG